MLRRTDDTGSRHAWHLAGIAIILNRNSSSVNTDCFPNSYPAAAAAARLSGPSRGSSAY
jgi:hypothetical protein